ncbi:hypothetical protein MKX03_020854, partial [Papaver bracteatum]
KDENMKEIITLADLEEKGLQNKDPAETGNHVDPEKGDNENFENEAALAELEAVEKTVQNGSKSEYMPHRLERDNENLKQTSQHGDNENLEEEAALAELESEGKMG